MYNKIFFVEETAAAMTTLTTVTYGNTTTFGPIYIYNTWSIIFKHIMNGNPMLHRYGLLPQWLHILK